MKRTAAILGPTPPLLRWAIEKPCAFRDIDHANPDRVAISTFTQLRVLRAASAAHLSGRVQDTVAIHPHAHESPIESALGFLFEETTNVFGGQQEIENECGNCPANIGLEPQSIELPTATDESSAGNWAGCFGWLPFDTKSSMSQPANPHAQTIGFQQLLRPEPDSQKTDRDLPQEFEAAVDQTGLRQQLRTIFEIPKSNLSLPFATPTWFSVWSNKSLTGEKLRTVNSVLERVENDETCFDFARLKSAVKRCHENELRLHVDLVPRGESDGLHWTLEPQCQTCGITRCENSLRQKCHCCGSKVVPFSSRKTKVLGLRPYLRLASVIGKEKTESVIKAWRDRNSSTNETQ